MLGGHYFKAFKLMAPRLEDKAVQAALEGQMVAACFNSAPTGSAPVYGFQHPTSAAEVTDAGEPAAGLPLFALASEAAAKNSAAGSTLAGGLVGAVSSDVSPILLDTEQVTLEMGEAAWVPAVALVSAAQERAPQLRAVVEAEPPYHPPFLPEKE